ncbi:SNARE-binding exocyst subunit S6 [Exophiala xenobiotica]|nr:SNARE-binding exocyst subunit S6 [Exophiala xenobiotica]
MAEASKPKTWLATGASQGLGLAITLSALRTGHKVIAGARKPEVAAKAHPEVEAEGGRWLQLDVDSKNTTEVIRKALEDAGGVDVVVNNAGWYLNGTIEDLTEDEMQASMNTNFWGPIRVIKGVLPSMRARKSGTIVAISSIHAIYPIVSGALYSCPKAAHDMLQAVLSHELASFNIRTITINAGLYKTDVLANSKQASNGLSDAYLSSSVGQLLGTFGRYAQDPETNFPGDPKKLGDRLVEVVDGTGLAQGLKKNQSRFLFGRDAIKLSDIAVKDMLDDFEASALTSPGNVQLPTPAATMAARASTNGAAGMPRLHDTLRTPEDLEKITSLKAEINRKKGDVDARLREGLKDHLDSTQNGMSTLAEGQKLVGQIKEEMKSIHDLCEQAQAIRKNFPQLDYLARVHRNFEATRAMQAGLDTFERDCSVVQRLLEEDEIDPENQPNLLEAHMRLTRLRDFRDESLDQIRRGKDSSLEQTLLDWFQQLDDVIFMFDDHIGRICMKLIELVQQDNRGLIVRLAIVIASEEKNDDRVRALQDAQKDHQDLVSKFTSFTIGPKTIRGYKEKFTQAIEFHAQNQFEETRQGFQEDPSRLDKATKWFFNDLFVCKQGMQSLFPRKWKIFDTYVNIYHKQMHDFLLSYVDAEDLRPPQMLAIVHYIDVYYQKMSKLGLSQAQLKPHVLDSREGDLIRDYRNIITKALNSWIDRMYVTDMKNFKARSSEAIEQDPDGHFRTKTLPDMWRMLHEQAVAAGDSEREDVVEGVMSAMFSALKSRQQQWEKLVDEEVERYKNPTSEQLESLQQLQDWLLAIANDQIACVDDAAGDVLDDPTAQKGYLTRFREDFTTLPTPPSAKFMSTNGASELDSLRDGYVDLATHCLSRFVQLIFRVDFRSILTELFVPGKWYEQTAMQRITTTFDDYIGDYGSVLHPSLLDILIEELSDALLVNYLTSIRTNKGVKFRRGEPFPAKFRDDVLAAFAFFEKYPDGFNDTIKPKWKAVNFTVQLLEADKVEVVGIFSQFKREFWDLQLSWVEAALKTRDDWDRSMITAVKQAAASTYTERSAETIMGKVK